MSRYLLWILLTSLTHSPVLSAVVLLVVYWGADRYTLGVLPDPVRYLRRWGRASRLERTIAVNPHDRRAAGELAAIRLGQKRYAQALSLSRRNLEAGDEDPETLYTLALACLGSGHVAQGEQLLDAVETASPRFRLGQIKLERGRWRLARGDWKGAVEALEEFCAIRSGTVEGKVLLARAYLGLGNDMRAAELRRDAWRDFVAAPRFVRRTERFWAWRARPLRPALYAVVGLTLAAVSLTVVGPHLRSVTAAWSEEPGDAPSPDMVSQLESQRTAQTISDDRLRRLAIYLSAYRQHITLAGGSDRELLVSALKPTSSSGLKDQAQEEARDAAERAATDASGLGEKDAHALVALLYPYYQGLSLFQQRDDAERGTSNIRRYYRTRYGAEKAALLQQHEEELLPRFAMLGH